MKNEIDFLNDPVNTGTKYYTMEDDLREYTLHNQAGPLYDRYQIYLSCVDNGKGIDKFTGKPIKTFDEWLDNLTF